MSKAMKGLGGEEPFLPAPALKRRPKLSLRRSPVLKEAFQVRFSKENSFHSLRSSPAEAERERTSCPPRMLRFL